MHRINLENTITNALAPMEGISDFPCRLWFHLVSSPDYLCTPFLRVTDGFIPKSIPSSFCPELFDEDWRSRSVYQIVPQLMAKSPDDFCKVAEFVLQRADFVDLNCGCPSPTVIGRGAGSSLLQMVDGFAAIISKIVTRLGSDRVSVKMRTGFDSSEDFSALISGIADIPLKRLTVHGRTRREAYTGQANWKLIAQAAQNLRVPVVGSGDIVDAASWENIRARSPEVAGYLIGRGAIRNPWIFIAIRERRDISLSYLCLKYALASFTLLHDLPLKDLNGIKNGMLLGENGEAWKDFYYQLNGNLEVPASRWAFSRTKLLWNYMRSSLPEEFFSPSLFRAASQQIFYQELDTLYDKYQEKGTKTIPLTYQPAHDWIYAGRTRQD